MRPARQPPWNLCSGSVEANLLHLQAGPEPTEETTRKIWLLLRLGCCKERVCQGVQLMQQCLWSIGLNTQMHGQQASVRKLHAGYCAARLLARSMVCLLRPLVAASAAENRACAARDRLATLARRRPDKVSGWNMYVRDVLHLHGAEAWRR